LFNYSNTSQFAIIVQITNMAYTEDLKDQYSNTTHDDTNYPNVVIVGGSDEEITRFVRCMAYINSSCVPENINTYTRFVLRRNNIEQRKTLIMCKCKCNDDAENPIKHRVRHEPNTIYIIIIHNRDNSELALKEYNKWVDIIKAQNNNDRIIVVVQNCGFRHKGITHASSVIKKQQIETKLTYPIFLVDSYGGFGFCELKGMLWGMV
jgi:hypothetical protein